MSKEFLLNVTLTFEIDFVKAGLSMNLQIDTLNVINGLKC